jgi:inner membrane protein
VDNICHTLVGAAMGYAGLRRTTRFATATLMIASNLPDLDVLVFATETPSIEFRRGWTHGILAQALLPVALTAVTMLVARRRRTRRPDPGSRIPDPGSEGPPLSALWLLALSYLGILSHVFLDFLNNYGIRLLTPFDWRWFYGDTLFIIDPWLWLTLGVGIGLSRYGRSPRAARVALVLATVYIGGMLLSARTARAIVLEAWARERGGAPVAAMVGPVPLTPFDKQVIIDAGAHYEIGSFTWLPSPRVAFGPEHVPKNDGSEEVAAARQLPPFRSFLVWSRFPYFQLEEEPAGTRVSVGDMRFSFDNPVRSIVGRNRFTATALVPRSAD